MSYTNSKTAIQVLISKVGTKVVTATNLHAALELPAYKFNSNIERWVKDIYQFNDSLRKPIEFKDFAKRNLRYAKGQDFYLTLELAKMIALNSESKLKASVAKFLLSFDDSLALQESVANYKKDKERTSKGSMTQHFPEKSRAVQLGLW